MRGGRWPHAGRTRKPVAERLRLGLYYRPCRHGARPVVAGPGSNVLPMPKASVDWTPEAGVLAGLGAAGRAYVESLAAVYTFKACEGPLVLEAAHMVDRLSTLRASGAVQVREEILVSKHLAGLLAQLKPEDV